jgi:hypothetical protein
MGVPQTDSKVNQSGRLTDGWRSAVVGHSFVTCGLTCLVVLVPDLRCYVCPLLAGVFSYLFAAWFDQWREYGLFRSLWLVLVQLWLFTGIILLTRLL